MTLKEVYVIGKDKIKRAGVENPGLEASLIISTVFGIDRIDIYTKPETEIELDRLKELDEIVERRIRREPVAYLMGETEFYSRKFFVGSDVLIPRPETEILTEEALNIIRNMSTPRVIDVGTGSGCIALTIGCERNDSMIIASDVSFDAILVAKANATRLDVDNVAFVHSDFLDPLKASSFDIVVSNPPYVSEAEFVALDRDVRDFEPSLALRGGRDGLDCVRRVASGAISALKNGGWCVIEIGRDQDKAAMEIFRTFGYRDISFLDDLSGIKRVIKGRWIIS